MVIVDMDGDDDDGDDNDDEHMPSKASADVNDWETSYFPGECGCQGWLDRGGQRFTRDVSQLSGGFSKSCGTASDSGQDGIISQCLARCKSRPRASAWARGLEDVASCPRVAWYAWERPGGSTPLRRGTRSHGHTSVAVANPHVHASTHPRIHTHPYTDAHTAI